MRKWLLEVPAAFLGAPGCLLGQGILKSGQTYGRRRRELEKKRQKRKRKGFLVSVLWRTDLMCPLGLKNKLVSVEYSVRNQIPQP